MKKILWLTSWYPNRTDMFTGDFIQRHAKAASLYNQIIVLHVAKAEQPFFTDATYEEINNTGNLIEHIAYFKCDISFGPLNKLVSLIKYYYTFRKLILHYLDNEDRPDFTHVHVPLKAGLLALWVRSKFKIDYFLTEHYCIYNDVLEEQFKKKSFVFQFFVKKIIKRARIFSTVSQNTGEEINKMVVQKPFSVIYNVVNTSLFYYIHTEQKKIRFIHVSNSSFQKNTEGIIKTIAAVSAHKDIFELLIVGKYSHEVFGFAESTGLLNKVIFFTGEVSYNRVAQYMQNSHCLIMFSRAENMPCVVLEALCCGLPVIATNVGGIPEVISNSNGILVKSGNETELKQAITTMLEKYNSFDRENISKEAAAKFKYETIGKQISNLYDLALSHPPY